MILYYSTQFNTSAVIYFKCIGNPSGGCGVNASNLGLPATFPGLQTRHHSCCLYVIETRNPVDATRRRGYEMRSCDFLGIPGRAKLYKTMNRKLYDYFLFTIVKLARNDNFIG
jgi:hypothetical protein